MPIAWRDGCRDLRPESTPLPRSRRPTPRQIIRKIISMQSTPHRPFITTALSIDTAGKISDEPKSCRWVGM